MAAYHCYINDENERDAVHCNSLILQTVEFQKFCKADMSDCTC